MKQISALDRRPAERPRRAWGGAKLRPIALLLLGVGLVPIGTRHARADQIVLDNGEVLEGRAEERGSRVIVHLDMGTVSFQRREIREIRRSETAIDELERRRQTVAWNDAASVGQLAEWAKAHGLDSQARALYRRVVELKPEDARAHEALGERQLDGRWLSEDEYMTAKGYVRYGGQWLTAEQVQALEAEATQRQQRRQDQERIRALESKVQSLEAQEATAAVAPTSEQTTVVGWPWRWRRGVGVRIPHPQRPAAKPAPVVPLQRPTQTRGTHSLR